MNQSVARSPVQVGFDAGLLVALYSGPPVMRLKMTRKQGQQRLRWVVLQFDPHLPYPIEPPKSTITRCMNSVQSTIKRSVPGGGALYQTLSAITAMPWRPVQHWCRQIQMSLTWPRHQLGGLGHGEHVATLAGRGQAALGWQWAKRSSSTRIGQISPATTGMACKPVGVDIWPARDPCLPCLASSSIACWSVWCLCYCTGNLFSGVPPYSVNLHVRKLSMVLILTPSRLKLYI